MRSNKISIRRKQGITIFVLVCTYTQTLYSTTNTLALRIRAARHRYVLICDKNSLPFEIWFFLSLSFFVVLYFPLTSFPKQ